MWYIIFYEVRRAFRNVLIYEDENIYIDKLRIVLSKYNVSLTVCSTADDFLNCSQVFDIALVDIEVEGLDGLNATRILKTRSKNCIVVAYTHYDGYAVNGYKYGIDRYILKTATIEELSNEIEIIINEYFKNNNKVQIVNNGIHYNILLNDIVYIESCHNSLCIHLLDKDFTIRSTFSDLLDTLDCDYIVRVHKGFAINLKNIFSVSKTQAVMINKEVVPIGKSYREDFENQYFKYSVKEGML